ncbi:MAG: hypothetical protein ACRCSU_01335 [Paracoccaceae bacterium]
MNRSRPHIASLTFACGLLLATAVPAVAEGSDDTEKGFSLMEQGARLVLRELMSEMEPAMRDMGEALADMEGQVGPAMAELARMLGDMSAYHLPEQLPNGDIIVRRKQPLPAAPDGGVDL